MTSCTEELLQAMRRRLSIDGLHGLEDGGHFTLTFMDQLCCKVVGKDQQSDLCN